MGGRVLATRLRGSHPVSRIPQGGALRLSSKAVPEKEAERLGAAAQRKRLSGDTKAMGWLEQFGDIIMFVVCNARICKKREETLKSLLSVYTFYPKSRCIPPIISYLNNPDILLSEAK